MTLKEFTHLRADFEMLNQKMNNHPLIYFDNAATTLTPKCVVSVITNFYEKKYGTVHRALYQLSQNATYEYFEVRKKIAKFLNANQTEEIIFTSGTTASINLVAHSFSKAFLKKGDEIIISALEHHSNIVPWQLICEQYGTSLKVIPIDENACLDLSAFERMLNDKTRLVAITHISNAIGVENPIKEMIQTVRKKTSAKVLIDGAQSAPHIPVDVQDLDTDFFVFSAHKAYGPTGVGVLYGKKELLEQMPPYQSGGDMIETVDYNQTTFNSLPHKFEAGTPNIAGVIGFGEAIDYLQEIDREALFQYETLLAQKALEKLMEIEGVIIIGNPLKRSSIISFIIQGVHSLDVATFLDLKGIALRSGHHCAQPLLKRFGLSSTLRISFSFYNTPQEIDYFIFHLKEVISRLR